MLNQDMAGGKVVEGGEKRGRALSKDLLSLLLGDDAM